MNLIEKLHNRLQPPLIVAELSGNHNQCLNTAKHLIELAAANGADAIKLQTYTADSLTLPSRNSDFLISSGLWAGNSLYELYSGASTPYEWHKPLADFAKKSGIPLFSTPFDTEAVDLIESTIDPPVYKISSFELNHIPLLRRVAKTQKPVFLSTGMATISEIREATEALLTSGTPEVILLKCVNAYPSDPCDFNLNSMQTLASEFNCRVGLSDHTLTNDVALAATALGARVIEKHFTHDRAAGGVDAQFSMEPNDLKSLVSKVRLAHSILGSHEIKAVDQEVSQLKYRRSIYLTENVEKGEMLTDTNLKIVRPNYGLPPKLWSHVIGKIATRKLKKHTPLQYDDFTE